MTTRDSIGPVERGLFAVCRARLIVISCGARVVGFISMTEPSKLVHKAIQTLPGIA